jgi:hypothetical protein
MKGRESGMPEEVYWQSFFNADCIVEKLECAEEKRESIAEFASGYGTFTIPAAKRTSGVVHTFDIEPELVALVPRGRRISACRISALKCVISSRRGSDCRAGISITR